MDSSQSNDPFRGEGHGELDGAALEEAPVLEFDEARWRRAGATDDQVAALHERWDGYTDEEKANEDAWMKATSDPEIAAYLNPQPQAESPTPDPQAGNPAVAGAVPAENQQVSETVVPATADAQTGAVVPSVEGQQAEGEGDGDGEQQQQQQVEQVAPPEGQQPVGAGGQPDQANVTGAVQTAEPTTYTAADVPDLPNAKAVEDWVGDDKAKAQAALEKERAGENRKGLTAHLERIVGA